MLADWAWHPDLLLRNSERVLAIVDRLDTGLVYITLTVSDSQVSNRAELERFLQMGWRSWRPGRSRPVLAVGQ